MEGFDAERELPERVAQPVDVAIGDPTPEIDALHQLHGEEPAVFVRDELVEGDEVRVRDVGERAELMLEPVQPRRIEVLQRLQRDLAALGEIAGAIDHTHRSRAEPREDLEPRVAAEVSGVHGVTLRKGAHHTESMQLCWKVATILPFRPREATNSSERRPGCEDWVNRGPSLRTHLTNRGKGRYPCAP